MAADNLGKLQSGYDGKMLELETQMANVYNTLDIHDEAREAAEKSIDAYIVAIMAGTDDAVLAAEAFSLAVGEALAVNLGFDGSELSAPDVLDSETQAALLGGGDTITNNNDIVIEQHNNNYISSDMDIDLVVDKLAVGISEAAAIMTDKG